MFGAFCIQSEFLRKKNEQHQMNSKEIMAAKVLKINERQSLHIQEAQYIL